MPVSIQDPADDSLIDVFADDMDKGITLFCDSNNIDRNELYKLPQSMWSACLMYIHRHVMNDPLMLKSTPNYNNAYNFDKVNKLYDTYVYYSNMYNKVISLIDFCRLSGIDSTYVHQWENDNNMFNNGHNMASDAGYKLMQKIRRDRERALTDRIVSTNNAVGLLGVANREYQWNQPATASAAVGYKPAPRIQPPDTDRPLPKMPEIPQNTTE